ncbi:DNA polymerase I, partial [Candidatus Arthromitus sp. SFB-5]
EKFDIKIKEHSEKIYSLSGEVFNINSPKQLGKILFEKLDLPVIRKTKTGYSTNAEVLEALMDKHEIIEEIVNYRQITKLQSTYILGLMDVIDYDFKVHTSFNQTLTATGRLSSVDPNLQNIPIKYPLGREIRKAFIAEKNSYILSADYSQIET